MNVTAVAFYVSKSWIFKKQRHTVRGNTLTETATPTPHRPGTVLTICMSCFMTGGPGKEHGTNKPPPTRRVQERSNGDTTSLTTSQNPSLWHPSWLNKARTTKKDSESEWLAKDNLKTNPITIKPETASHMAELSSWVLLPYCSPPGCPFPIKSLALSAHVSPRTIHFQLREEPSFGPWKGSPFCSNTISNICQCWNSSF